MSVRFILNTNGATRRVSFQGKQYLAVATVMLTEGVHKGSRGRVLYHRRQLSKHPMVWNMKPVVVYHPSKVDDEGNKIDVPATEDEKHLERTQVGFVMNTRWDSLAKKLRCEVWLDEKKLDTVDKRVMKMIRNGKPVEVSTGLGTTSVKRKGTFKGERFDKIATHLAPEHLAILPDQEGACSIRKGAGMYVTNGQMMPKVGRKRFRRSVEKFVKDQLRRVGVEMVKNELSFSSVTRQIQDALAAKFGEKGKSWYGYIHDIYDSYCVYCPPYSEGSRKLYAIDYAVKDDVVSLTGDPVEVKLVSEYKTAAGEALTNNSSVSQLEEDESPMATTKITKKPFNRVKHIEALITNGIYRERDREYLEEMDSAELRRIRVPQRSEQVNNSGDDDERPGKKILKKKDRRDRDEDETPSREQRMTFNQMKKAVDPETRAMLEEMKEARDSERGELVETICNNANNVFEEEWLAEQPLQVLRGMAELAKGDGDGDDDDDEGSRRGGRVLRQGAFVANRGGTSTRRRRGKQEEEIDDTPLDSGDLFDDEGSDDDE